MAMHFIRPALIKFAAVSAGSPVQPRYLSDHNRSELSYEPERIVSDIRTWGGNLRRSFIADRYIWSWSWTDLPNRDIETVDGYMGADSLIDFWSTNSGEFAMFLTDFNGVEEEKRVMFDSFSYSLTKRWHENFYYDIDISVVEIGTNAGGL